MKQYSTENSEEMYTLTEKCLIVLPPTVPMIKVIHTPPAHIHHIAKNKHKEPKYTDSIFYLGDLSPTELALLSMTVIQPLCVALIKLLFYVIFRH